MSTNCIHRPDGPPCTVHCGAARHSLGFEDEDLGSSPCRWAHTVATYCPSRPGELPKFLSSKPCEGRAAPDCRESQAKEVGFQAKTPAKFFSIELPPRAQGGSTDGGGSSSEAVKAALANVKCKRMPIREQNVSDACVYTVKNTGFHMASELSLNREEATQCCLEWFRLL